MDAEGNRASVRLGVDIALDRAAAFELLVDELEAALARLGIAFIPGPDGRLLEGTVRVGEVTLWIPGEHIKLSWKPRSWEPDDVTEIDVRLESVHGGTRIEIEHRGWGRVIGSAEELTGWFAGELVAPFLRAAGPSALGDWLTDRWARRPSGPQARAIYRDPLYHYPNFRVILEQLDLKPTDFLLEVGCGGGAFLKQALQRGCRAAAIDHSPDMVVLARRENRAAIAEGRLDIQQADAQHLPFDDTTFTCAVMTGVLGFLTDPVGALAEIRRVLRDGGRFVGLGSDPELKGTPGAPEPVASRLHFYDDDELARLGREAGFGEVRVIRKDLEPYARAAGVPEEHISLFAGENTRFLLARRGGSANYPG